MRASNLLSRLLGLALGMSLTVSTSAAPAVVEKGTSELEWDDEYYLECLGEEVLEVSSISYEWHMVTTPGGKYVYHELWLNLNSVLYGESGTVWTLKKNVSPFVERTTGGGATHWTARTTFESDTGQTIEFRNVFHISFDANGEVRVDRLKVHCWVKD